MTTAHRAVNALAFQATWFASVLGAGRQWEAVGIVAALACVALRITMSRAPSRVVAFVGATALAGFAIDTLLLRAGALRFGEATWPPAWMTGLWLAFATLPRASLSFLAGRTLLAGVLGAVGGPLSYAAGARLGAVTLGPPSALWLVALAWGFMLPLMIAASDRWLADARGARA